jgi:hypothetical protein
MELQRLQRFLDSFHALLNRGLVVHMTYGQTGAEPNQGNDDEEDEQ